MKILVFAAFVTLCSGHVLPTIPGDNSHYVEGESRYIWLPDDQGKPLLVDLHEPVDESVLSSRNGADNAYWLFTRQNRNNRQVIVNGQINTLRNSNFRASRPTKVIVHGWRNSGTSPMNPQITEAFLNIQDCNVIVVDWSRLAGNVNYNTAAAGVPSVGQHLGNFLVWVFNNMGGNWNQLHLVGFSLGAHIVGVAGRTAGRRPGRVTGLDPAGPGWGNNNNRLSNNAGNHVEAIHTDGRIAGIMNPVGDADFYPNGGMNPQPGCAVSTCSHGRATELFAATVQRNHLVGRRCNNIWEAELTRCTGANLHMGNGIIGKRGSGLYGLLTGRSFPF
ncbi:lipase member I-like [Manduca sexta]|uniref:lipase member I n=1 Tax=Manduca sexta TaxID=7130 RepID=UPI00188F5369|nr:lipase member I [Manduca sexta]XP_037302638.1 lipase member I-like [Manduca sexta]